MSGNWRSAERLLLDGLNHAASKMSGHGAATGSQTSSALELVLRDPRDRGIEVGR